MRKITSLSLLLFLFFACGESPKKISNTEETPKEITEQKNEKQPTNNNSNTTYLCKLNGEDWGFTEASGLVSRNSSTNVRTATIGFRKKLDKGHESIQLEYDVDANTVTRVLLELKRSDKDGNLFTNFYNQSANQLDKNPEASMSGSITLSEDERVASGNAKFTVQNDFEKDKLANASDVLITVTDLNFSDINYSDTDDLKKLLKK